MIRLFAHRGFCPHKNIAEHSVASLKKAYKHGFRAVEFDIWVLKRNLVLAHDQPRAGESLTSLSDFLLFGNEMDYWLDFKNLTEENAKEVMIMVKKDFDKAFIDLKKIYFAPFITDYKIAEKFFAIIIEVFGDDAQLVVVCDKDINALPKNIKFLSIFHDLIDENFMKKFPDTEIFAWTVNDLNRMRELEILGVKNFTTDKITPRIYDNPNNV
ncbi:MAG: hypothetical protein A2887_00315 [Alphaproteobacteria bacterium RIFCSPLOWO2_01_FULL_40_26]|nr:MAG: hypothetical protein A3D15_06745 [Alphaproteobacteria bacterium RIFCSPHIGHO2_02_FULL_40_34]OFW94633.1 MAG: hypothetical protein A2887_00315 [Alphaproteobacteria bacterium RIFCSPLOWO2_01_FULL_40_26]OFX10101.1 MAG: hypothetical protein A3H30_04775 [Alphaproteobacteria bacterium RIFCSPLOWO2_02_FULL_40_19]OFX11731.1 MAG: hypothetical protein A3G22_04365 [Alphaproteobacteria bacterium RIFCSPLOWO2_12_FULL_40_11]